MSRLRQIDYLQIAERLRCSRDQHELAFIQLNPSDQLDLIMYFGLDERLTPEVAVAYRQHVNSTDLSLPQRAGKALRRYETNGYGGYLTVYGEAQLNRALLNEVLSGQSFDV